MEKLNSKIIFGNIKLKQEFEELKSKDIKLHSQIVRAFNDLEEDAFCGIQIPKRLFPKEYEKKFGDLSNLWKYNLPGAWRLIYTIKNNSIDILSIILEWMDHKEYERRFKY